MIHPVNKCTKMTTNSICPAAPAPALPYTPFVFGESMKKYYLRSCVALACAFSMTACGGSDNDMVLYVSVFGVTMPGLKLTNNGGPELAVAPGTSIAQFPELVGADSNFDIEVVGHPPNATCVPINGKGKTGSYSPNNISVVCTIKTYNLGGTIKGLSGNELILINGSDRKSFNAIANNADQAFTMTIPAVPAVPATADKPAIPAIPESGKVAEGNPYGVLIYKQPTTGTCKVGTVENSSVSTGIGIVPRDNVTSIVIECN